MKDFHIYLFNAREYILKYKILFLVIFASIMAIALPGAISFAIDEPLEATDAPAIEESTEATDPAAPLPEAEEATEEALPAQPEVIEPEEEAATEVVVEEGENADVVTVKGKVGDEMGVISADKNPYVQIAGIYAKSILEPTATYEDLVNVGSDGTYQFTNVPANISLGLITAGADGYANEILALPGASLTEDKSFVLYPGSKCEFTNGEYLDDYQLCAGSSIKLKDSDRITLPLSIALGEGLPTFGVHSGSTFTETYDTSTLTNYLTYYYKDDTAGEEFKLIFAAVPVSGYQFNY